MTDALPDGALQALWQSQSSDHAAMSLEAVREKARQLERRVARRNRREYIAAVVVVVSYGWILWRAPTSTIRVGAGLILGATLLICYRLYLHGSAAPLDATVGITTSLEFYCGQLERQRDLLRSVWRWCLLPLVPGFLVLLIGTARAQPAHTTAIVVYAVLALMLGVGLHVLNSRAAARIERALDRLKESG